MIKMLIVDDSKLSRKLFLNRVPARIRETAQIVHGSNGQEAVDLYKEHSPDVVFLDLTMPVMDGYEALSIIMDYNPDAVVYIITADIQKKAKERVLASGARAIETKPIEEERLDEIFCSLEKDLHK